MSARASYEAPVFRVREYEGGRTVGGAERRSDDPVNQLGRALDQLCLEASDPYEIAAHLEALGYNSTHVAAKYGVADHFELARALFYRTPRRLRISRLPSAAVRRSYARQLVMVLTLLVTATIGMLTSVIAWAPMLWLLVWSQLGGALLNQAKSELGESQQLRILSLLLLFGTAGMALLWLFSPFMLGTATVSALWLGVAGLLWAERVRAGYLLAGSAGALVALSLWGGLLIPVALLGCLAVTPALLWPQLRRVPLGSWRWAAQRWPQLVPFVLYGLGQGALLLALLYGAGVEALPGVALFALVLLVAEPQLLRLRARLNLLLWKGENPARYAQLARFAITRYAVLYLLTLLPALLVWFFPTLFGSQWLFHLFGFALFGLVLVLGLVALSLGDAAMPALIFGVGGAAVVLGLPFLAVVGVMACAEFAALLRHSALLGSYGVYLL